MQHLDEHNILSDNQHGFRKRRSCETQLLTTIQEIASNTAKGKQVDVILLDFAKAFDKVPHARLMHTWTTTVLGEKRWVQSFLRNRKQQVVLDAFFNDLPDVIKSSSSKLFADDSAVFKVIKNDDDVQLLKEYLAALEQWEEKWQMSFNPTKCTIIRIAPRCRKIIDTKYSHHCHTLEVVDAIKYLGVTITESLTWENKIVNIPSKANRTLGFLRRNLRECTPPVKEASYMAMVRPSLENAATGWDPHQQNNIKAIEQVQRRAAHFVFNDCSTKTPGCVSNMIKDLNWESIEQRRKHSRLSMMYKIRNNLVDINADRYLQSGDARTRGQHRLFQRITDQVLANSFFPRTVREWNLFPASTVSATTIDAFRLLLVT
ncbi:uncharacterized protein LOC128244061 [Mya arenaria]|uniref:uncharacterized protein LOC128244061 n=1 Tax=Mya arenaria TaxID=6604 RepID=UPI0022DFF196|nr:uncharacterized protein LOC128244061 [Mya arenaria]